MHIRKATQKRSERFLRNDKIHLIGLSEVFLKHLLPLCQCEELPCLSPKEIIRFLLPGDADWCGLQVSRS